jgi:hypothetical protein
MSLQAGRAAQQMGLDLVESNSQVFTETMRGYARMVAKEHGQVTSDDLREYARDIGLYPHHQNAWGAIFRSPMFTPLGFTHSRITSNRARVIRVWGLQ